MQVETNEGREARQELPVAVPTSSRLGQAVPFPPKGVSVQKKKTARCEHRRDRCGWSSSRWSCCERWEEVTLLEETLQTRREESVGQGAATADEVEDGAPDVLGAVEDVADWLL